MTRKICVALDESQGSQRALNWALDYASESDIITLVTAVTPHHDSDTSATSPISPPRISSPIPTEDGDEDDTYQVDDRSLPEASPEELLLLDGKFVALQSGKLQPDQVHLHILEKGSKMGGSLGEVIMKYARDTHQNVLILGNRSFEARRWKLLPQSNLGRVSEYCVKHADDTAVVVVGQGLHA